MGILCGVTVDEKVYNDFALKRFRVPHDFKPDVERTLYQIEFFANCKDYQKNYPEFYQACKDIVEQEKRSIQSYYAKQDGRKEYIVMKHNDFMGYLKDLQEIQKGAAKERRELKTQLDRAKKKWEESKHDKTLSEYGQTAAKMEWLQAEKAYKEAVADLRKRTDTDIDSLRAELENHLSDFYSANGDRIDEGTVRLLHSGISLSEAEINRLVEHNMGNPTMLRVISDHCEKNKINNKAARIYGTYAKSAGKHERDAFNEIVGMIGRVTGTDETLAEVWSNENSYFNEISIKTIEGIAALSVHPGAEEE